MPRGILKENLPQKVCISCNRPFTWRKKWERCWDEVTTCSKSCNAKRKETARARDSLVENDLDAGARGPVGDGRQSRQTMAAAEAEVCPLKGRRSDQQEVMRVARDDEEEEQEQKGGERHHLSTDSSIAVEDLERLLARSGLIFTESSSGGNSSQSRDTSRSARGAELPSKGWEGSTAPPEGSREHRRAQRKAVKAERRAQRAGESTEDGRKACDLCTQRVDLLLRCTVDASKQWHMVCGRCWKEVSGGVTDGDAAHPHYTYGGLWKNRS